jgi:hypothetical protein
MFKDREKLYQAYHTMLSMALTWALALLINQNFQLRVPIVLSAVFSFVPPLIIYIFDINKKNAVSYIILASIIPILGLIFWIRRFNPLDWLNDFMSWCETYDGTKELLIKHHANFAVFGIALIGALLFYLLTKKQFAKVLLAVVIMAALIVLCVNDINVNKAVVGIGIFYLLSIIVEMYGIIYSRKGGKQEKREGILYLAPVCLLLAVLSISLPSKQEPIEWRTFKNIYNSVKDQIEIWRTDLNYYFGKSESEFFVNLSGYSETSGSLSNNEVVKDSKVALKVSGSEKDSSVYLIGSISDIYTGSSWEKSNVGYLPGEKEYLLDYIELFYAFSRQNLGVLENNRFVKRKVIRIDYNNIKTKTFFYPLKTCYYDIFSGYKKLSSEAPQITFKKGRGKGTSYQSIFYEMNLEGEAFQQMLRDADTFSYDKAGNVNTEVTKWLRTNIFIRDYVDDSLTTEEAYQLLAARAELINAQYTSLPEELPDRVKELAEKITKDYDTTYDKLKAIEAYLNGYEYTLSPEKVPEDKDFADFFLFESKAGYCTSYATAMAVLGRCIGIPTRYVEGYIAKFDKKGADDMYPVKNGQAHAWAEAYITGIGWIPFEATAPFYENRYKKWTNYSDVVGTIPNSTNPYEQYMEDQEEHTQAVMSDLDIETKDENNEIVNGILILLAAILIIIVIVMVYYLILKIRYNKEFDKADYSRKMYMLFLRILKLLQREGFSLDQQETILMLSKRVKDIFHYDRVTFPDVANIFMRYRYAEAEVTKAEFDKVAAYHLGLTDKKRGEESRFKVWLDEFIFLAKKNSR